MRSCRYLVGGGPEARRALRCCVKQRIRSQSGESRLGATHKRAWVVSIGRIDIGRQGTFGYVEDVFVLLRYTLSSIMKT